MFDFAQGGDDDTFSADTTPLHKARALQSSVPERPIRAARWLCLPTALCAGLTATTGLARSAQYFPAGAGTDAGIVVLGNECTSVHGATVDAPARFRPSCGLHGPDSREKDTRQGWQVADVAVKCRLLQPFHTRPID